MQNKKKTPLKKSITLGTVSVRLSEPMRIAVQRKKLDLYGDIPNKLFFETILLNFEKKYKNATTLPPVLAMDKKAKKKTVAIGVEVRARAKALTDKFACNYGDLLYTALCELLGPETFKAGE